VRRGQWADELERLIEASWDLVISVPSLVRLGVPERTAYRRTLGDGPWQLLLPATILLSNGLPTFRQWQIAALVYAGPDAVLTGLGGARLHGLRRGAEPEKHHVLIPATRNVKSAGPVIVERTRRPVKRLERDGLPVAPIARCLLDHVRRMKDEDEIAALLTEPVQRRMVLKEMLVDELDLGTRKGSAAPRRVLRAVSAGVESPTEFRYHEFWTALPGLPPVRCNVGVFDLDGTMLGIVDFLVDEVGLVWESDSVEEHFATPDQVLMTTERARRLRGAGLYVISTRPHQLRDDPRGVETDIRQGLEIAASMPPPRVTYGDPRAA
jgi:hypothetical protein